MAAEIKPNLHLEIGHILFIDVVGYSKLLTQEQSELIEKLSEIVLQTEQVRAADAAGQLIRLATGDGMALVFRNHPEAPAETALQIATALKGHPEIRVRMGVHSGPVNEVKDVNHRANIAGAGVNMAQRVMDCGDAGHILLSKRAADDLAQYREWQPLLHDLGEVEVKHGVKILVVNLYDENVGNPAAPERINRAERERSLVQRRRQAALGALVIVAALAIGFGTSWWSGREKRVSPAPIAAVPDAVSPKSIAVLPLENLSDDKANAFFADGIQDDVLTSLAKIKDLKVISRTSVMSYRDKAARNLKQIGKELGVANVLEGSVRRVGDRVLVVVQLIDTATDQHIWAERYDRTLADSITLQGELASEIAGALRSTLSPEEKARVAQKPTDNPEAYEFYLRGREVQLRTETSRENYVTAIAFYKQAIAVDPKFVLARARLGFMQAILYSNFDRNNGSLLAEARANADEAARLDANSAEAHIALARCAQNAHDDATAKRELAAALRLNPNDAWIAMAAAITQAQSGWSEDAAVSYKRAAELGPREPKVFYNYGVLLMGMRKEAESRAALDHALELAPDSVLFRCVRATAEVSWSGDIALAKAILASLPVGRDPDGMATAYRCSVAVLDRDFPEALRLVQTYPGDILPAGAFGLQPKAVSEGMIHLHAGDYVRAYGFFESVRPVFEAAVRDQPDSISAHSDLALLYAVMAWKELALAEVARTTKLEKASDIPPERRINWTEAYARIGDVDRAWAELQRLLLPPYSVTIYDLRLDPIYDPLRSDPRFQKLIATNKL